MDLFPIPAEICEWPQRPRSFFQGGFRQRGMTSVTYRNFDAVFVFPVIADNTWTAVHSHVITLEQPLVFRPGGLTPRASIWKLPINDPVFVVPHSLSPFVVRC